MKTPFKNSYWVIQNQLMAGEIPASIEPNETLEKLNALIKSGINVVINLMEEDETNNSNEPFFDYASILVENGIECLRYPIQDLSIPSEALMHEILTKIENCLINDKKVYVHCWGGVGRTGTVIGCFLKNNQLATNETVFQMIDFLKKDSGIQHRNSPETLEQEEFVKHWS